jgi:hypothetical protein
MSEDQKKKPGRPIGGFDKYKTLGRSKQPEPQITGNVDVSPSASQDSQIASNSDKESVQYPESQTTGYSDMKKAGEQNKQMVSYLREKKPERKAQIAYLPPVLIKRLKLYALQHDLEISEVVAEALEHFLDAQEGR